MTFQVTHAVMNIKMRQVPIVGMWSKTQLKMGSSMPNAADHKLSLFISAISATLARSNPKNQCYVENDQENRQLFTDFSVLFAFVHAQPH
jgi:hypothetical protein